MNTPSSVAESARQRLAEIQETIARNFELVESGRPQEAEPDFQRRVAHVQAMTATDTATARQIVEQVPPKQLPLGPEARSMAEALQGKTVDYLGAGWLDAGRRASNAVARIIFRNGSPQGTGFLISDRLLLTNQHVIATAAQARGMYAEFRYEVSDRARQPRTIRFELDPDTFYESSPSDQLDFAVVALGRPIGGSTDFLGDLGCCPLSDSSAKHAVGCAVNVIQHPDGDLKQIVIRESYVLNRGEFVLHYSSDTEPGSSGSPVFNDLWQVVALHHWGEPYRETRSGARTLPTNMNEGVRISAIVRNLRQRFSRLTEAGRSLLQASLSDSPAGEFGTRKITLGGSGPQAIQSTAGMPVSPLEPPHEPEPTSQPSLAEAGGRPASRIDRNYTNRRGYNPRFLPEFAVPMPQLTNQQQQSAARVSGVGMTGNPFELKYQHFSVVMNAQRRLPFFAICNIEGSRKIKMSRDGQISRGPESDGGAEGAEATESWATDPRIPREAQLDDAFYARLRRRFRGTEDDFFARGHMCRREDPIWGNAEIGLRANDDTFHHTNACPQLQDAFNGSSHVWLGLENYVLNAADDMNLRVTVITGPVLTENDFEIDDVQLGRFLIPKQYWKIAVRVEDGTPHVVALLADQSEGLTTLRDMGREATFAWPTRLSRDYISTVARIEELTGLNFGDLGLHDDFADRAPESLTALDDPRTLFSKSPAGPTSFGRFANMAEFLNAWDAHLREQRAMDGAERRRRPTPGRPTPRRRKVVEVESEVALLLDDDLSGSKHQLFEVRLSKWLSGDAGAKAEIEATIRSSESVRVSIRYGDSAGLPERIREIRRSVKLHLKGEWISPADAYVIGGRRMAVLHFTHEPLGFICTPVQCYD